MLKVDEYPWEDWESTRSFLHQQSDEYRCAFLNGSGLAKEPRWVVDVMDWWLKPIDFSALDDLIDKMFSEHPGKVAAAKTKPQLAGWFVGQIVKTDRALDPKIVKSRIEEKINEL